MLRLDNQINLGFEFIAPYVSYPQVGGRPEIEVEIAAIGPIGNLIGYAKTVLLVDSGADCTVLDTGLAPILGIDLAEVEATNMGGVGDAAVPSYESPVQIMLRLCETWVDVAAVFVPNQRPGLLGRAGAFDALRLAFVHSGAVMIASTHP